MTKILIKNYFIVLLVMGLALSLTLGYFAASAIDNLESDKTTGQISSIQPAAAQDVWTVIYQVQMDSQLQ